MGTRNLTLVKRKNKIKVAQYGQWDGYPTGQGKTIAEFLESVDLKKFISQIDKLGKLSDKDIEKAHKEAGHDGGYFMGMDVASRLNILYPALNRDHGAGILDLIYNGVVKKVFLWESFKEDRLYCEYYYTIDVDKKTVSMNGGKEYPFKKWTTKLMKELEADEKEDE